MNNNFGQSGDNQSTNYHIIKINIFGDTVSSKTLIYNPDDIQ